MDDFRKPRHIRDIAHLYLSRMPAKPDRHVTRVWVVAASRECFGAYHAANLALGIAGKGHSVELIEASGVIPCAAYFLRLPPRVYIKHKTISPNEPLSALGGITVRFSLDPRDEEQERALQGIAVGGRSRRSGRRVELVHLPPAGETESVQASVTLAGSGAGSDEVRALVLAADESTARDTGHRTFDAHPRVRWSTLSLERRLTAGDRSAESGRSLGYLVGWHSLLSDPVPCVLRDPESHVARSYLSICEALVTPGSTAKERNERTKRPRAASLGQTG
jgi:hypothetical protein